MLEQHWTTSTGLSRRITRDHCFIIVLRLCVCRQVPGKMACITSWAFKNCDITTASIVYIIQLMRIPNTVVKYNCSENGIYCYCAFCILAFRGLGAWNGAAEFFGKPSFVCFSERELSTVETLCLKQ